MESNRIGREPGGDPGGYGDREGPGGVQGGGQGRSERSGRSGTGDRRGRGAGTGDRGPGTGGDRGPGRSGRSEQVGVEQAECEGISRGIESWRDGKRACGKGTGGAIGRMGQGRRVINKTAEWYY